MDGNGASDVEEGVAAERRATITLRLRLLALASLGIVVMFIATGQPVRSGSSFPFVALRVTALGVLAAFFAATYRPAFARVQLGAALLLCTGIASLSSAGGMLRHDISIAATLHLILVLLNAAVLPWGIAMQGVLVGICSALMAAVVSWVGVPAHGDPDVLVLVNVAAGYALSVFVAYQTRDAYDRSVRENLQLRQAEEKNRLLNEELEAKVRARTGELHDALADQRAVTRAISHDLRQPLRHIEGYTRLLEEDLGDSLEADDRDRLGRLRVATARMWRMVDSLLELTRVAVRPVERRRFALSECAGEILAELARGEPTREVAVKVQSGLADRCDPELTRTLLRELLANAWKFTRETEHGEIEFGRRDGAWFVRDNGAGFQMEHTRRLFQAFERLHHSGEYEGEGMGLAVCERIVRRHGGRIWAESEPGAGASFLFTLGGEEEAAPPPGA